MSSFDFNIFARLTLNNCKNNNNFNEWWDDFSRGYKLNWMRHKINKLQKYLCYFSSKLQYCMERGVGVEFAWKNRTMFKVDKWSYVKCNLLYKLADPPSYQSKDAETENLKSKILNTSSTSSSFLYKKDKTKQVPCSIWIAKQLFNWFCSKY